MTKKKKSIQLGQKLLLPLRLINWLPPPLTHSCISAMKEKVHCHQLRCIKEVWKKKHSPDLPWATPGWTSTKRTRIPAVAHILTKLQPQCPIPLLCPLFPIYRQRVKHINTHTKLHGGGNEKHPPPPPPPQGLLINQTSPKPKRWVGVQPLVPMSKSVSEGAG